MGKRNFHDSEYIPEHYSVYGKWTVDRWPYITIGCEHGRVGKPKAIVDDEDEFLIKTHGLYGTKKYHYPFILKWEELANGQHWKLSIQDRGTTMKYGLIITTMLRLQGK